MKSKDKSDIDCQNVWNDRGQWYATKAKEIKKTAAIDRLIALQTSNRNWDQKAKY